MPFIPRHPLKTHHCAVFTNSIFGCPRHCALVETIVHGCTAGTPQTDSGSPWSHVVKSTGDKMGWDKTDESQSVCGDMIGIDRI